VAAGEDVSVVPRVYETLGLRGVAYTSIIPEPEPFAMVVAWNKGTHSALTTAFVETRKGVANPRQS